MLSFESARQTLIERTCGHRVVFHHVPKCGGTSIERALRLRYAASYATVDLRALYNALACADPELDDTRLERASNEYREAELLSALYFDTRCIAGHIYFSATAHRLFSDRYHFVTTLRDPIDFFVSFYHQMVNAREARWQVDRSLEAFLETPRAELIGRFYTLYFSGLPDGGAPIEESVRRAKANLLKFDAVGFVDAMPSFNRRLRELLGVPLWIGHANRSRASGVDRAEMSTDMRRRVSELSAPNIDIYEFARRELAERETAA